VKISPLQIVSKQNNAIKAFPNCRKIQHYTNGCTIDFCEPPAQGSTATVILDRRDDNNESGKESMHSKHQTDVTLLAVNPTSA